MNTRPSPPSLPVLLAALLFLALLSWRDSRMPQPLAVAPRTPLPAATATATVASGWWDGVALDMPALRPLPGLPRPGFGGGSGQEAGQRVPFEVVSCATAGVRISDIRTAAGPWWLISGAASIADLWYWKAEISGDGQNWAGLYQAEAAVADGVLVRLNLTTIPSGRHLIRLTAVDRTGNYPEPCVVGVVKG